MTRWRCCTQGSGSLRPLAAVSATRREHGTWTGATAQGHGMLTLTQTQTQRSTQAFHDVSGYSTQKKKNSSTGLSLLLTSAPLVDGSGTEVPSSPISLLKAMKRMNEVFSYPTPQRHPTIAKPFLSAIICLKKKKKLSLCSFHREYKWMYYPVL